MILPDNKGLILVFDVETDGLARDMSAPCTDTTNWPHVVQLAFQTYTRDRQLVNTYSQYIIPRRTISERSREIHGITTERATEEGVPIESALLAFGSVLFRSKLLVAHNLAFDRNVVMSELIRQGLRIGRREKIEHYCTMKNGATLIGGKWPKLEELYLHFFNRKPPIAHDAGHDVFATQRCFFRLCDVGLRPDSVEILDNESVQVDSCVQ